MVDTSTFSRAHDPMIRTLWTDALLADRLRRSVGSATGDPEHGPRQRTFDELAEELSPAEPRTLRPRVINGVGGAELTLSLTAEGASLDVTVAFIHSSPGVLIDQSLGAAANGTCGIIRSTTVDGIRLRGPDRDGNTAI